MFGLITDLSSLALSSDMTTPSSTDEAEDLDETNSVDSNLSFRHNYLPDSSGTPLQKATEVAAIMEKRGFTEFANGLRLITWSNASFSPSSSSSSASQSLYTQILLFKSFRQRSAIHHSESTKTRACLEYDFSFPSTGCDIWPDIRGSQKRPAKYALRRLPGPVDSLDNDKSIAGKTESKGSGTSNVHWPPEQLPTELFEEIASYLSRDDVKSMRLVCQEFDRHISQVLFRTVVVRFNTEIFGMLESQHLRGQDVGDRREATTSVSCSRKMEQSVPISPFLAWTNGSDSDLYDGHGLEVFRGFGPHIIQFGMSFAVQPHSLAHPPDKIETEKHETYWGTYEWPHREYQRFESVADLEVTADENCKMTTAFSYLSKVKELALSIDSCLGWLAGPDKSIRSIIIRDHSPIFGSTTAVRDRKYDAQRQLWRFLQESYQHDTQAFRTAALHKSELWSFPNLKKISLPNMLPELQYLDPSVLDDAHSELYDFNAQTSFYPSYPSRGVLFASTEGISEAKQCDYPLLPDLLTKNQKEWLLETEWAQRAFLSSYMLSIMDNRATFENIHTLTMIDLSSRFLSTLTRSDFWNAVPALKHVKFGIIADWRDVVKEESGEVETPQILPTSSMHAFHHLLNTMIKARKEIESLQIGWNSGGERATGVHARNKHLMPTPLWPDSHTSVMVPSGVLVCPHVKHLTLSNCWITPPALLYLVDNYSKAKLSKLTLDSVSLTVLPSTHPAAVVPPPGQIIPPPTPLDPSALWKGPHRPYCWPDVLNGISPAATLSDYVSDVSQPNLINISTLDELELKSCGYAKVTNSDFMVQDDLELPPSVRIPNTIFFNARFKALESVMMVSKDPYLGVIRQWIPDAELEAMDIVWGLKSGWEDVEEAEAVEFDGGLKGGTGRVSGIIKRSDYERLSTQIEA